MGCLPPPPDRPPEKAWETYRQAARVAARAERYAEAVAAGETVLETARATREPAATIAELLNAQAGLLRSAGRLTEALPYAEAGLAERRRAGVSEVLVGNDLMMLANVLADLGEREEAAGHAREALAIYVATHGAEHREVRFIETFLARLQLIG